MWYYLIKRAPGHGFYEISLLLTAEEPATKQFQSKFYLEH